MLREMTSKDDWKDDFLDFYFERGKYEKRQLGPQSFLNWIAEQIHAAEQKQVEHYSELLRKSNQDLMDSIKWERKQDKEIKAAEQKGKQEVLEQIRLKMIKYANTPLAERKNAFDEMADLSREIRQSLTN